MADITSTKIVSLANLTSYDTLIKKYLSDADAVVDAKSIKTIKVNGDNIEFYKKATPGETDAPDFTVAISSSDVEQLLGDVEELQGTLAGYSSTSTVASAIAAAEKNVKDHADEEVKKVNDTIGTVAEGDTVVSLIADAKKAGTDANAALEAYKTTNDAAVGAAQDAADAAQGDVDALEEVVGDMTAVKTTAKTVAGAVDELKDAIDATGTAGKVTMEEAVGSGDVLKTYTFWQGEKTEANKIGVISLAKDLVVTGGEVVVDPEGQPAGTYLKLTIANQEAPVYINVKDLVEDFTVAKNATQVQLAVSETREISAELVDGGVATAKLADSAVTTVKIADENVTKGKLAKDVQASLEAADAAAGELSSAIEALAYTDEVEGDYVSSVSEANGVITLTKGTFNFDEKGSAAKALEDAQKYADDLYEVCSVTDINDLFKDSTEEA